MTPVPTNPKIFHITHLNNLSAIASCGFIYSDGERIAQGLNCEIVGMSAIKERRLKELEVDCHPGTRVGEYVPFYFCPRSVMLYLLHMGNHPDLTYSQGQRPIVHLQADLYEVIEWATQNEVPWAFSRTNAGAFYTDFYSDTSELGIVDWSRVFETDFRDPMVKEAKQAEFLVFRAFPWDLVEEIGVMDRGMAQAVNAALQPPARAPRIVVKRNWYY